MSSRWYILYCAKSSQALRLRAVPSAFVVRDRSWIPFARLRKEASRKNSTSTIHGSRLWEKDELPPPMFTNGQRFDNAGSTLKVPKKFPKSSNRPTPLAPQENASSDRLVSPWVGRKRSDTSMRRKGKRKADEPLHAPPKRRQYTGTSTKMRDEAFMRRTLVLPTKKEYPSLPSDLLRQPKGCLHNTLQSHAEIKSSFQELSRSCFSCVVSCSLSGEKLLLGTGEGLNKVCLQFATTYAAAYNETEKCRDSCVPPLNLTNARARLY